MAKIQIYTDGGSRGNPGPAGIGVVVILDGSTLAELQEHVGTKTNNEAEYLAFQRSLSWLKEYVQRYPGTEVEWRLDSKLVVEQIQRHWKCKEARIAEFLKDIWSVLNELTAQYSLKYTITHVPRAENSAADLLVNQALDNAGF